MNSLPDKVSDLEIACQPPAFLLRAGVKQTMYRQLDAQKIVDTARTLQSRINERFPDSGLSKLGSEVSTVGQETMKRMRWIQKPHIPLAARHLLVAGVHSDRVLCLAF